jgi:uncharacterized glyoxalase superfamily protein PhnB
LQIGDAAFKKAVGAGVMDPFGHSWPLATHEEDVAPER